MSYFTISNKILNINKLIIILKLHLQKILFNERNVKSYQVYMLLKGFNNLFELKPIDDWTWDTTIIPANIFTVLHKAIENGIESHMPELNEIITFPIKGTKALWFILENIPQVFSFKLR